MENEVQLLEDGIIYVQKIGPQTKRSMLDLFSKVNEIALDLRAQNKPVLILSNATQEGMMDDEAREIAARIGSNMEYDKSATYGTSPFLLEVRKEMIAKAGLGHKVADFEHEADARAWLLE
jgi:hypothetical protein